MSLGRSTNLAYSPILLKNISKFSTTLQSFSWSLHNLHMNQISKLVFCFHDALCSLWGNQYSLHFLYWYISDRSLKRRNSLTQIYGWREAAIKTEALWNERVNNSQRRRKAYVYVWCINFFIKFQIIYIVA